MPGSTQLMTRVTPETVLYTADAAHQAAILRSYCESAFQVGESTEQYFSVTGEPYQELSVQPDITFDPHTTYPTPEAVRVAAQEAFDKYAKDKSGTLYWRVVPEIALRARTNNYVYYMRLLISDKPRKS